MFSIVVGLIPCLNTDFRARYPTPLPELNVVEIISPPCLFPPKLTRICTRNPTPLFVM